MGSVDFSHQVTGKDADSAFELLCDRDAYERGHGPYSGGIGQKKGDGFVLLTKSPISEDEAQSLIRRAYDSEDGIEYEYADRYSYGGRYKATFRPSKYGPTGCLELLPEGAEEIRTVELTLPVMIDGFEHSKALAAVRDHVKLRSGERISDVQSKLLTFERRAVVEAPKQPTVTRYHIRRLKGYGLIPGGSTSYTSQAEARAVLTAHLKRPQQRNDGRAILGDLAEAEHFEIIGITRRSDGQGLVVGRTEIVKPKTQFTVKLAKRLPAPPRKKGDPKTFLFFGLASS